MDRMVIYYWVAYQNSGFGRCVIENEEPLTRDWFTKTETEIKNAKCYNSVIITNVIDLVEQ